MTWTGWAEIALILALIAATAWPLGVYMARVLAGEKTLLSRLLGPAERGFYALAGVDAKRGMGWKEYAFALLLLNALHFLLLYAILRLQFYLPFNPQGIAGMSPRLAFNTAISFVTNTNWQAYSGESAEPLPAAGSRISATSTPISRASRSICCCPGRSLPGWY